MKIFWMLILSCCHQSVISDQCLKHLKSKYLTEFHKLSQLLSNEMDLFPKGNKVIIEKSGDWILDIDSSWNPKRIDLKIKSRKENLSSEFTYCSIRKAPFIRLLTRYDN